MSHSSTPGKAGLCGSCLHAERIASSKGSVFLLCALSRSDRRFAKYPRLPVLSCPGYASRPAEPPDKLS